ncbi:MAG: type I glutamate--ammonia ligase [Candidatus Jidaibacter sp.]|jgi:glutamine synthetase|nr:type I glutamate--ammonia ligase [Candidatus Jidaibacter sp.]
MVNSAAILLKKLHDESIKFISFCFSDIDGKFHRITYYSDAVDEKLLKDGISFDASSIKGWKEIHHSDALLKPNLATAFMDPFTNETCLCLICDVIDVETGSNYSRDPRSIAINAESYAKSLSIADEVFVGPEMEFFIFDDIKFGKSPEHCFYQIDAEELPHNSASNIDGLPNLGHRTDFKGGYFPAQPFDKTFDIRAEMAKTLESVDISPMLHHHEVAASQAEIGFKYSTLLRSADNAQKFKYVVKNVANSFGKTATFMPKPIFSDNGSGMHTHISLWKSGSNLFYNKDGYAGLSDTCLYFIGGIIKHAKSLNAFTNPTTNSYKRLVPGFEAPVNLAYSERNRSAAIRIPYCSSEAAKRIEIRFPDPSCNPYLSFAAIMMAGLDGIKNKIHPGAAIDKDLYHLDPSDGISVQSVCGSLKESLQHLSEDKAFLLQGGVFADDFIDNYIKLKMKEIQELELTPHPVEFKMYYSC